MTSKQKVPTEALEAAKDAASPVAPLMKCFIVNVPQLDENTVRKYLVCPQPEPGKSEKSR